MEEMLKMIANVGFPIVVAAFLLIRVEQRIDDLSAAINELREAILVLPREPAAAWFTHCSSAVPAKTELQ